MITFILAVWFPLSVPLALIIGGCIRLADEHAPHAEPEHEAAA